MSDLKPCPFCGASAEMRRTSLDVRCSDARCREATGWTWTRDDAWNTRPTEEAARAQGWREAFEEMEARFEALGTPAAAAKLALVALAARGPKEGT